MSEKVTYLISCCTVESLRWNLTTGQEARVHAHCTKYVLYTFK